LTCPEAIELLLLVSFVVIAFVSVVVVVFALVAAVPDFVDRFVAISHWSLPSP
jgi:hypothetical protein